MKTDLKKFEDKELSIVKVDHIKSLKGAGVTLEEIVKNNPFIKPTGETIGAAETARKALKLGRTTVSRFSKEIKSGLNSASKKIEEIASDMRSIVESAELKQQDANDKFFDLQAWEKAKEENTKSAFVLYLDGFGMYRQEAEDKINDFEIAEEKQKQEFTDWTNYYYSEISKAGTLEQISNLSKGLDDKNLDAFINPALAYEQREMFYNLIDEKETAINKAELERKAAKEKAEAEKIAAEKRQAEFAKQQEQAAKVRRAENFANANFVFDTITDAIENVKDIDKINHLRSKLETVIEKDFGKSEDKIKELYKSVSDKLTSKKDLLLKEIQKQRAEAAKLEQAEVARMQAEKDKEQAEKEQETTLYDEEKQQALGEIEKELETLIGRFFFEKEEVIDKYDLKNDVVNFFETLV